MNGKISTMVLVLGALAVFCLAGSAWADNGDCCGGGYGYGYPGWFGPNRLYQSDRQIPYFAEHPPVYYSYPVPRTYGYSPYAYPGWFRTPEVRPQPLEVINPHVPQDKAPKKETSLKVDRQVSLRRVAPLVVVNPYVRH